MSAQVGEDNEKFRAALAEALALAKDPRHVIALSRVYAHTVGALEHTTDVSQQFREMDLDRADRRIQSDLEETRRRRVVDVVDADDDDDVDEDDEIDDDDGEVGVGGAASYDDDGGGSYSASESSGRDYASGDATEAILEYEAAAARRGASPKRRYRAKSPRRAGLEGNLRDREREYRQLLARASMESARGDPAGVAPSAKTSRALVGAIQRLERSSDELRRRRARRPLSTLPVHAKRLSGTRRGPTRRRRSRRSSRRASASGAGGASRRSARARSRRPN